MPGFPRGRQRAAERRAGGQAAPGRAADGLVLRPSAPATAANRVRFARAARALLALTSSFPRQPARHRIVHRDDRVTLEKNMHKTNTLALAVAAALGVAGPAFAQTNDPLRDEVRELRNRTNELEKRVQDAEQAASQA